LWTDFQFYFFRYQLLIKERQRNIKLIHLIFNVYNKTFAIWIILCDIVTLYQWRSCIYESRDVWRFDWLFDYKTISRLIRWFSRDWQCEIIFHYVQCMNNFSSLESWLFHSNIKKKAFKSRKNKELLLNNAK
jgi:hypothetical protein